MSLYSEKKIKVCFISPDAYMLFDPEAEGTQGGAEVDSYYIGTELAKDDRFRVSFITLNKTKIRQAEGVGIITTGNLHLGLLWAMFKANADIYFKKGAGVNNALIALFCKIFRRKYFFRTAHDIDVDGTYLRYGNPYGRYEPNEFMEFVYYLIFMVYACWKIMVYKLKGKKID